MEIEGEKPLYNNRELNWHPNQRVREIATRLRVIEREFRSSVRWATITLAGASLNALFVLDGNPSWVDSINVFGAVAGFAAMAISAGAALKYNSEATALNTALATHLLNENKPAITPSNQNRLN